MNTLTTDARPTSTPTLLAVPARRPRGVVQTLDRIDLLMAKVPCRGENRDDWFSKSPHLIHKAKRACAACPVRSACLRAALDHNDNNGVWGGLGPDQRKELRRRVRDGKLENADLELIFGTPADSQVAA